MPRTPAARARGITKYFGDVVALDGVDLDVEPGQVHGLVGPNGAGKTTLLGLLLGLAVADSGRLEILGTPGRAVRSPSPDGVAGFVDGPGLYPSLTARQNLAALAALRGCGAGRASASTTRSTRSGSTEVADDRVRGFSLGMRQRLGLAAALLTRAAAARARRARQRPRPRRQAPRPRRHRPARGGRHRGRPLQPPHGRPRRTVLRGHHPRHRTGRLLRPAEQAGRREP